MPSRRSFLVQAGLLALAGGAAWVARERVIWPIPQARFDDAAAPGAWISFVHRRAPLVTVPAQVNGRDVTALIDSGAQYSVIDQVLADEMGLAANIFAPLVAYGAGGGPQVARGATIDVALPGVSFASLRAARLDIGPISQASGLNTPVILGHDVLSTLAAEMDFPGRRVRFAPPGSIVPPPGAIAAPVRKQGRAMMAQVEVEGVPLEVLVDTGATGVLGLSTDAAEAAGLLTGREQRQGESVVLGGVVLSRIVTARTVTFGGEVYEGADVHILDLPDIPWFPKGLLGVEAFRGFRVILDAGAGTLHLVRG